MIFLLLSISFCFLNPIETSKIGIFSGPLSKQQVNFAVQLGNNLINTDNEIILIRPNKSCKDSDINVSKDIHQIFFNVTGTACEHDFEHSRRISNINQFTDVIANNRIVAEMSLGVCENILNNTHLINELMEKKLDLAILSDIDYCLLGIFEKVGLKKYIIATTEIPDQNILLELGIPVMYNAHNGVNEKLSTRVQNYLLSFYQYFYQKFSIDNRLTELFQSKYGSNFPSISSLREQIRLIISGAEPILHNESLYNNKIHLIGQFSQNNQISKNLDAFLKNSNKVVIINMDEDQTSFKSMNTDIIKLIKKHENIKFVWVRREKIDLPQNAIVSSFTPSNVDNVIAYINNGKYSDVVYGLANKVPSLIIEPNAHSAYHTRRFSEKNISVISNENVIESFEQILTSRYHPKPYLYQSLLTSYPEEQSRRLSNIIEIALHDNSVILSQRLCIIQLTSLDILFVLLIPTLILLAVLKKIASLYYWSCFDIAYKEKVKSD